MTTPTDRERRHAEFLRLYGLLPGPTKAMSVRQAAEVLQCSGIYVRRCIMAKPDRVPSWDRLELMEQRMGVWATARKVEA